MQNQEEKPAIQGYRDDAEEIPDQEQHNSEKDYGQPQHRHDMVLCNKDRCAEAKDARTQIAGKGSNDPAKAADGSPRYRFASGIPIQPHADAPATHAKAGSGMRALVRDHTDVSRSRQIPSNDAMSTISPTEPAADFGNGASAYPN